MAAQEKKLFIFANLNGAWVPGGLLTLTEDGPALQASKFAYGTRYLERADAIEVDPVSLSIKNKSDVLKKEIFPTGNLPYFGGIRDAAPDAWGRRVIEAKLKVPANSLPESEYLLHAGSERIGALDIRSDIKDAPKLGVTRWESLQYLIEAADRIDQGLPIPANLEIIFQDGSGLGGARPKASVRDDDGVIWLAKFDSPKDAFGVPDIEVATLKLAKECGLTVPPVKTEQLGNRKVMLIRRFDRYWASPANVGKIEIDLLHSSPGNGAIEKRLAFASGLTLIGCDESLSPTKSYADLAAAINEYCHPSVIRQNKRELFARMVYNILVSNDDDHLRNHGFIFDPNISGWRLSPLYDVMPRPGVASERQLHLGIGEQGRSATLDNAMTSCERFSLSKTDAEVVIGEIWSKVREWRVYFDDYGVSEIDMDKISSAFRHVDETASNNLKRKIP